MAKSFNYDVYVKNLPDCYRKDSGSNNYKILEVEKQALSALETDANAIYNSLDIWQATGKTLDLYGEMYNAHREDMSDDQYRMLILLRLARNRANSDQNSIVSTLASILGVPVETFWLSDSETSGNVDVNALPYNVLSESGIKAKRVCIELKSLLGAGIGIGKFNVVHDVPENDLKIATAITHGVEHVIWIEAATYETVKVGLEPAIVMMYAENFNVEVV